MRVGGGGVLAAEGAEEVAEEENESTPGTRVVTFPFEIRPCTYGFENVERHK